jgi:hypothetical protein
VRGKPKEGMTLNQTVDWQRGVSGPEDDQPIYMLNYTTSSRKQEKIELTWLYEYMVSRGLPRPNAALK